MNKHEHHEHPEQMKVKYFSFGTKILTVIAALGMTAFIYRFFVGLGGATNLDNQYPWGIWIAIDVASGVALAAGGFTTAALAEIFHKEKYHSIIRPALLTAMLGYTFVAIGLLADLGRYYNIWHPMLPEMWSANSALFEVAMCVMIYLTVLYIEFLPIAVERFKGKVNLPGILTALNRPLELFLTIADKTLGRITFVFIIAGVVLSCLHQSSLGTLMIIAPTKMHPLWYSLWSPLLFLLSAISVGFPMVIFESILASKSFKIKPEKKVLSSIARYTPIILTVYFIIKILDLVYRDAFHYLWEGSPASYSFLIELLIGVIIPTIMLLNNKIRNNINGLFIAASMVIFGVVLNRINVYLVAYNPLYEIETYFPSVIEIAVTIGLISTLILIYRFIVIVFPVISIDGESKKEMENRNQVEIVK